MRRAPALIPLSHDHHQALEAALVLQRAASGGEEAAIGRFLAFWEPTGREHFAVEEDLLLPALEAIAPDACARVRDEHGRIREAAASVSEAPLSALQALGRLLRDHVRFEERELFPLAERELGDDGLAQLFG